VARLVHPQSLLAGAAEPEATAAGRGRRRTSTTTPAAALGAVVPPPCPCARPQHAAAVCGVNREN